MARWDIGSVAHFCMHLLRLKYFFLLQENVLLVAIVPIEGTLVSIGPWKLIAMVHIFSRSIIIS